MKTNEKPKKIDEVVNLFLLDLMKYLLTSRFLLYDWLIYQSGMSNIKCIGAI